MKGSSRLEISISSPSVAYDRRPYLSDEGICKQFELSLELVRRRYVLFVFGYVVMPEHVHLLISEPRRGALDRAIQALKTSVSKYSSHRPFWLVRYCDFNVHSAAKKTEKLRCIHRNPVTRGLVDRPEDWKWSSFRHYLSGEVCSVEIESSWTAGRRQGLKVPEDFKTG